MLILFHFVAYIRKKHYLCVIKNSIFMDCLEAVLEDFEYELIDISWSLDYDFGGEAEPCYVADDSGKTDAKGAEPCIEYDANGVPMGGSMEEIRMRGKIIKEFFQQWAKKNPKRCILNIILQEHIYIKGISVIEAMEHAAKSYKSTQAVFLIDEVLKNARPIQRLSIKPGNVNQANFEYLLAMCYKMDEIGTIKLTVGIKHKNTKQDIPQKVQYGISVLRPEEPFVEQEYKKVSAKRKASHRKR